MAKLQTTKTVKAPVPFFANLAAATNQTVVSNPISVHYKIVGVEAHFTHDAAHNLQMYVFASNNRNASNTTPPPDDNVVSSLSPTPYLTGEGEIITLQCNYEPAPNYQYIKVYFANANAYAITGFCVVTIEAILKLEEPVDSGSAVFAAQSEQEAVALQAKAKAAIDFAADVISGTPKYVKDKSMSIEKSHAQIIELQLRDGSELELVQNFVAAGMSEDEKIEAYKKWFSRLQIFQAEQQAALIIEGIVGAVLPGGIQAYSTTVDYYDRTFPVTAFAGKINELVYHAAWYNTFLHRANEVYQPEMPGIAELTNEVVKEVIPLEEYKYEMKKLGYSEMWSQRIWDAHYVQPNYGDIVRAARRGSIPHDEIDRYLKLVDLDPRYNESVWYSLLEEVPGISDAVNMRVKEVIDQPQFEKLLVNNGFSSYWGQRFWDAHFSPAQFQDFLTAMRRKKTVSVPIAGQAPLQHTVGVDAGRDVEVIKRLGILADYDPRYWDFFETRMYNDPSYRMLQWGYEGGSIPLADMPDLVHRLGLNPKDEAWYAQFIIHFQERPWIVKYLTALAAAYTDDAINAAELKKRVLAIPRNAEIADWIIRIADVRKEIAAKGKAGGSEKLISLGELKQMRLRNIISAADFAAEAQSRGYSQQDVAKLSELMTAVYEETEKGGQKEGLTIAELFDAFKYSQIDESTLTTNLMQRGMNLQDIQILINTKKLKWGVEPA